MDTELVEKIVHEVKSQGVFDEFRKDSIADVDTKPAYQNLRQRVENTVKKFLSEQKWSLETNKNQLREKLRRHITESGFLDVGVERIVDQVVNPKICSVFQPRIEEIAYKYLGVPPPPKKFEPPPPPLMHPLPPLPLNAPPLKIETSSLLPTDLEQVSPDSDSATAKSDVKEDRFPVDMDADEKLIEDEDESPPFEPLIKYAVQEMKEDVKVEVKKETIIEQECGVTLNEGANKFEESNEAAIKAEIIANNNDSIEISNFAIESTEEDKEISQSVDPRISQDSQLSSVSSDSRLSPNVKEDSLQSSSQENVAANISEEAQMPKFNENSCEPNAANGNTCEKDSVKSELHFDIKKDEIKFEGTERKTGMEVFESLTAKTEEKRYSPIENITPQDYKQNSFDFATDNLNTEIKQDEVERTPNAQELSFGSSVDDSSSVPPSHTPRNSNHNKEKEETPPAVHGLKETIRPTTPTTEPIEMQYLPSPIAPHKLEKNYEKRFSSSSSSKHKKHSKEHRRSHEREKEAKERHRSGKEIKYSSKYHHSSGAKSSHKYSSSSSSSKYSSHSKSKEKEIEKYSTSYAYSSSKHTKHSHSHSSSSPIENLEFKKSKRDSDRRHHSSSSSSSKRSDKKDDHHEAKQKIQRRKTTDSNDDDDGNKGAGGGKSGFTYKSSSSSYGSKPSKSSCNENKPPTYKTSDYPRDQMGFKDNVEDTTGNLPINNVVILNDLLENPHTQFIQLYNKGHLVEMPFQQNNPSTKVEGTEIFATEFNNNVELHSLEEKHVLAKKDVCLGESQKEQACSCENIEVEENIISSIEETILTENNVDSNDLLYFEEAQVNFDKQLSLINATMDLCRSAVNSLRFDSLSDEGIELSNEEDTMGENSKIELLTETLKRKSEYNYENCVTTPRKRFIRNEYEDCQSKSSPTPSDSSSVNSKENEEICKNTNRAKKSLLDHRKANQKLSQQQRYSSEDLYKPRPILGQRSRRRGMDSLV